MKINPLHPEAITAKRLFPCYLIMGDEALIVEECLNAIRSAAKQQHYQTRERFDFAPTDNLDALQRALEHDSIFADNKLVELHLYANTMPAKVKPLLETFTPRSGIIFLIRCPRLTTNVQKSAWYRHFDSIGLVATVWPLGRHALPNFIRQHLGKYGFTTSTQVITAIAQQSEGNLLAIDQLSSKLQLLFPPGNLDMQQVQPLLHANSKFDIYALGEYALRGDKQRCYTIINQLRSQGIDSVLVLWALVREIRLVLTIKQGGTIAVWPQRQLLYRDCARRLSSAQLHHLLRLASQVDRTIKGIDLHGPDIPTTLNSPTALAPHVAPDGCQYTLHSSPVAPPGRKSDHDRYSWQQLLTISLQLAMCHTTERGSLP